jgi:hypothetical protein
MNFLVVDPFVEEVVNAVNKIKSINSWCTPILVYSFGTVAWSKTELEALDRKTRVMMTEYRVHHAKSAVERLYLPRKKGPQLNRLII